MEAASSGSCICIYLNDYESVCQYVIKLSASLRLFFAKPGLSLFLSQKAARNPKKSGKGETWK